jgi:hypothetical protein
MFRNFRNIAVALLLILPITAQAIIDCEQRNSFKFRTGALIHTSKLFREIYKTACACFEFEAAHRIKPHIEVWGNFDWISNHGNSIGFCSPTTIKIANFSAGLKFPFLVQNRWEFYGGLGASLAGVFIRDKTVTQDCKKRDKAVMGGVIKTGAYCFIGDHLFVDFFADYIFQPAQFARQVDVGGLRIGAGLGVAF